MKYSSEFLLTFRFAAKPLDQNAHTKLKLEAYIHNVTRILVYNYYQNIQTNPTVKHVNLQ